MEAMQEVVALAVRAHGVYVVCCVVCGVGVYDVYMLLSMVLENESEQNW